MIFAILPGQTARAGLKWLLIVLATTPQVAFAQAEMMTNGGFESPPPPVGGLRESTDGWLMRGPARVVLDTDYLEGSMRVNAHSGRAAVDLTSHGNQPGSMYQTVGTVSGTQYQLRFCVGNASTDHSFYGSYYTMPSSVGLRINGQSAGTFTNANVQNNAISWKCFMHRFVAAGSSTEVEFVNANPSSDNYAGLDDVSMLAVPVSGQAIVNGNFETAPPPPAWLTTAIAGWSVRDAASIVHDTDIQEGALRFNTKAGRVAADITGFGRQPGSIFQSVLTTANATIQLRFHVGNAHTNDANYAPHYNSPTTVILRLNGVQVGSYHNADVNMNGVSWKCFTHTFTSPGGNVEIEFANVPDTNDNYAGLDEVVLTQYSGSGGTTGYSYDVLGRLVAVSNAGGVNDGVNSTYGFDAAGNRAVVSVSGATAGACN